MNQELFDSKMIARVVMMAINDEPDLDRRIDILVNATALIHKECQTYDPLTESERLRSGGFDDCAAKSPRDSRRDTQVRSYATESLDRRGL